MSSGQVDWSDLSKINYSELSPEDKVEYQRRVASQRNSDIQEGLQAAITGDKVKLAELNQRLQDGFAKTQQLFSSYTQAGDALTEQDWLAYYSQKDVQDAEKNYKLWKDASVGIYDYTKNNNHNRDMAAFSNPKIGGTSLNPNSDESGFEAQERYIDRNLDASSAQVTSAQTEHEEITAEQEIRQKRKSFVDSLLSFQIWQNKSTVGEMKDVSQRLSMYNLYQNRDGSFNA